MTTATTSPALYADLGTPSRLEALLGAPDDEDNPFGFATFLAADERGDVYGCARGFGGRNLVDNRRRRAIRRNDNVYHGR